MLCSAPTRKSGGSNWLDRLRSAKGFPAGEDGDDLERFLSGNPESTSLPPIPISESTQPPENRRREPGWGAGAVTNVLSELFFIGGSAENAELSGKKFPRKQTNPRLCVASNNGGGNSNSSVRADQIKENKKRKMKMKKKKKKKKKKRKSSDFAAKSPATVNSDCNSLTKTSKRIDNMKEEEEEDEDEDGEEDEEGEKELRGYSRTEATVIDTSFADWKVERVMFRKKNVWKVMEKRGKPKIFGRKKRKHDDEPKRPWLGNGDQSVKRPSLDEMMMKKKKKKRSSDFAVKSPATVNLDSDCLPQMDKGIDDIDYNNDREEEEKQEKEGEKELQGYSRTKATVIDTSFADRKAERLVFRKKNVWKVVERRGNTPVVTMTNPIREPNF